MKRLFQKWGFHTTTLLDSDSLKIDEYLNRYNSLGKDDIFAFYYSGHGSYTRDTDKTEFRENEELRFKIDTNGNRGYLTIFSIENSEPIGMRAFRHRTNSNFEPIIARVRFTIL